MKDNQKLEICIQGLRDIINPIGKMKRELKEGYQLNGQAAYQLSKDSQYLQDEARLTLNKIGRKP